MSLLQESLKPTDARGSKPGNLPEDVHVESHGFTSVQSLVLVVVTFVEHGHQFLGNNHINVDAQNRGLKDVTIILWK